MICLNRGSALFKNYLTIAFRNILKRKTFSLINILGLAAGMGACFLILHYAAFELSYDSFHVNRDHIYRLRGGQRADSSAASAVAVTEAFPEVLDYAKFVRARSRGVYRYGEKIFRMERCYSATNSILDIFSFKIVKGDSRTALAEPNSIIITESTARIFFGDEDPIGKALNYNGQVDYKVTAVMQDVPSNSHIQFDILLSWATLPQLYGDRIENSWILWGIHSYLMLKPDTDLESLQKKLDSFVRAKQKEIDRPESFWEMYYFQPLKDIHLYSSLVYELQENGSGTAVKFLILIAFLIVAIAWSNYINLTTARSTERAKEVGVRKVAGADRRQLIRQFMLESFLINTVSLGLALGLTEIILPHFSRFAGTPDTWLLWQDARFWGILALVFIGGIAASGFYPAVILSSFDPVPVLKGSVIPIARGRRLRRGLVVFQFMVSAVLIAATLTVYKQITYMVNADLGVDIGRTLVLKRPHAILDKTAENLAKRSEAFMTELEKIPGVEMVSRSTYVPGEDVGAINEGQKADLPKETTIDVYEIRVDENFMKMYGLELLAGRNFSREFSTDSEAVILNDTARKMLQYESPESAVNTKFIYITQFTLQVIGVLDDYHQESLKQNFEPLVLIYRPHTPGYTSLKIRTQEPEKLVARVEKVWNKFYPGNPLDYFYLDERYERLYGSDWQYLKMFGIFSLLAIFVAGLGLFGLSLFNALQRTKEIGIRKALGADLSHILGLLVKDFMKLIVLANAAALPLFYLYLSRWLNKFPFRIGIGWWFFVLPLVMTFVISMLVVGYHSLKAATADPVHALRYE